MQTTNIKILFHIASQCRKIFMIILSLFIMVGALYGNEQYACVANSSSGTVTIVDLSSYTTNSLNVGNYPFYIKKTPGAEQLWISDPSYEQVKAVDISTGAIPFETYLNYCQELVISSDGLLVYVAYEDYPIQMKVYNTTNFAEVHSYSITNLNGIDDINLSESGDILYVLYNNNFYSVSPTNGSILASTSLPYYTERMIVSLGGSYAYLFADNSYIQRIDLQTFTVSSTYIGNEVYSLAISPDGQRLFAGFYYSSTVAVYDAETISQIAAIDVGSNRVMDLQVSSDGNRLYVLHRDSPNFQIYDIQSGAQLASVSTGSYSYRFDFDISQDSIPPQPISNLQVVEVYHNEVLLTWTAASDDSLTEPVRGYEVRYDTAAITNIDSARVYAQSVEPSSPGETDSLLMSGLDFDTDYWIAIRTYDEARNFSDPVFLEFTTLKAPAISISPDVLDFTVSIGDTATESITITNTGGSGAGPLTYTADVTGDQGIEQYAFVANSGSGTVSVIDFVNATIENLYVGDSPFDVIKSPVSNDLWVADINDGYLKVVDAFTGELKIQTALYNLQKILISRDGTLAYVVYENYPVQVKVYNATTLTEVDNFTVPSLSYIDDASISQDGQSLYMLYNHDFIIINSSNGSTVNSIYLSEYAERIVVSPDGLNAYFFGDYSYLQKVDLQSFNQISNYIGDQIYSLAVSPEGQKLYAGFYYSSSIRVYNSATLQQLSTLSVSGDYISDLKVSSNGQKLYVLHRYSPNLEIYNIQDGNQLAEYTTGSSSYRFDLSGFAFPFVELNPKSGKVEGGQSTQISFIINSTNLSHRTYNANLVVECNDPTNPSLTLPVTINAQDTKGPDFNMVFFQNPYLSQYLRVMVFAHETLNEIPQLTVDSDSITMVLHDTSYHIYMGKHQLSESGDFTFSVTGNDSLGNIGSFERILSVSNIQLGKPAMVSNISGNVAVKFPVNSFDEEVFVTIWEERNTESSEEPFGRIYHLGPEQMPLNESASLEISYSGKEDTNFNPLNLSIYKGSEGNWEEVLSKVDKGRKLVVGEIDQLGSFKLVYDPSSQSEEILPIPANYNLSQNYPNPFNPTTTIHYTLPKSEFVTLKVFDLLGREVKTLIKERQNAGEYRITFDASGLASGVYIYRIKVGGSSPGSKEGFIESKKMVLIR